MEEASAQERNLGSEGPASSQAFLPEDQVRMLVSLVPRRSQGCRPRSLHGFLRVGSSAGWLNT